MFKNILVPLDESANAQKAALVALELAQKYKAEINAISVVSLPEYGGTIGEVSEAKVEGEMRFQGRLEELRSKGTSVGFQIRTEILYGHPAERIIKYVINNSIDLVVIGHKGSSGIKEFFLGSVASRVVQHAPCSVLLVKD